MKTYGDYYIETRRALKEAGVEAYSLEARLLCAHAAEKTTEKFMAELGLYPAATMADKISALLNRRLAGEPIAYVTGSWEFYGMPLIVDENVLIPRMDTEVLVDTALQNLKQRGKPDARVLDLCTGSGCIACAIAKKLPGAKVVAADISPKAVSICRKNVLLNGLSPRVSSIDADALNAPPLLIGSFDLLVSNPPYIASEEIDTLDTSVRDYEPRMALDGGEDGLDFYRAIIRRWKSVIREGGYIMFEVGETQAEEVQKLLRLASFKDVGTKKDTAGIERVVYARV
jgi:release factor glutamine methyltransferase